MTDNMSLCSEVEEDCTALKSSHIYYTIHRFNKFIKYEDLQIIKNIILKKYSIVRFDIIVGGKKLYKLVFSGNSIIYATPFGFIDQNSTIYINHNSLTFLVNDLKLGIQFKLNSQITFSINHTRYKNLLVIARFY